ncbi:MAG: 3-oxosteroid 1-dehydrogenase [Cellvibrionaceae bacterium]|nr:3-oxosteroid 1-dehydrogenase [Cellvibrionaceae bacterium]|tara:strand:+ start:5880 stop:7643 length:1764 start_codon:yes stop_codon:yes gene_type:complete
MGKQNQSRADVIVVGSGAGAMAAAITAHDKGLSVIMIEKGDVYGGTSAMSGGGIWVPNHGKSSTVSDSKQEAWEYTRGLVEDCVSDSRLRAYLERSSEMLRYLEENTRLEYEPQDIYPDYYPEEKGGKTGGRTLDPVAYDATELGDEFQRMRGQHPQTLVMGRYAMTMAEGRQIFSKEPGCMRAMFKLMINYWTNVSARLKSRRDTRLVLGNALIGRLRHSMMDRDIPLLLNTGLDDLITEGDRVVGVRATQTTEFGGQESVEFRANHGVILGAGGFERNQTMREKYLPQPTSEYWSAGNPNNTGDAISAGMKLGADTSLMDHAWWAPAVRVEGEPFARILFVEKSLPGMIFVNSEGERYANEAAPYQDYGPNCYGAHSEQASSVPAYAIFDATYRKKYMLGPMLQAEFMPDSLLPKNIKQGFYEKADSIEELARKIQLPEAKLVKSIDRFNDFARTGEDHDFSRGGNVHDKYYGDKTVSPNPCLAALEKGPYYAVRVYPGDLGTKGGLLTDEHAQVVNQQGALIDGLYAVGNSSSSVVGTKYPGAGTTLGPAMTFGYLAALKISASKRHADASQNQRHEAVASLSE